MISRVMLFAAFGFMAVYILLMPNDAFLARPLIKATPAILLAIIVFREAMGSFGLRVGFGLLFSAVGDFVLDLKHTTLFSPDAAPQIFMAGLGSFLVAHVWYVLAFGYRLKDRLNPRFRVLSFGPFVLGSLMLAYLFPVLGGMLVPVAAYTLAISTMAALSLLRTHTDPRLALGAVLFMASDACIAINKFKFDETLAWAPTFIMVTYYAAQLFIATGTLAEAALLRRSSAG